MGKFLLLLLAFLLVVPRLVRLLLPRRPEPGRPRRPRDPRAEPRRPQQDPLKDLTQQDISDADYEEIPPEE